MLGISTWIIGQRGRVHGRLKWSLSSNAYWPNDYNYVIFGVIYKYTYMNMYMNMYMSMCIYIYACI